MSDTAPLLLTVVGLLTGALLAALLIDRLLARLVATGRLQRPEIRISIDVPTPIDTTWELLAAIDRQPEWMHEMKRVEMLTPPPVGVGSRGRATVRIFGIGTTDEVVITRYEPPRAFGIDHIGRFAGEGLIELTAIDHQRTRVDWMEYLRPPIFGTLGAFMQRPLLAAVFRSDLRTLRTLLSR